ncbi:MAG: DUF192 domain-containing protein [Minisyncoccales bacterium]
MNFKKIIFLLLLFFIVLPIGLVILGSFGLLWLAKESLNPLLKNVENINQQFKNMATSSLFLPPSLSKLNLTIAQTPQEQEKGLSQIKELKDLDGMLFVFDQPKERIFWNKETYLDLVVFWISEQKIVGIDYLPSIEKTKKIKKIFSPGPIDQVVEYAIKKNDDFFLFSPLPQKDLSFPLKIKGLARNEWFDRDKISLSFLDENNNLVFQTALPLKEKDEDFGLFEEEINLSSFLTGFLKFENPQKTKERIFKISFRLEEPF